MRLKKIQEYLKEKNWKYTYTEEDDCGSLDFEYRGVGYHVWEFEDNGYGAESNVRSGGRTEEFNGNYEEDIIEVIRSWQ